MRGPDHSRNKTTPFTMLTLLLPILGATANRCQNIKEFYKAKCCNSNGVLNTFSTCDDMGNTFRTQLSCTDTKTTYQQTGCCPSVLGYFDMCSPKGRKYKRCIVGSGAGALGVVLGLQDAGKDHDTLMIEKGRSSGYYDSLLASSKPVYSPRHSLNTPSRIASNLAKVQASACGTTLLRWGGK
jgi:hypothetical protein